MDTVGFVYMLRCADSSFYKGRHRGDGVEKRVSKHGLGIDPNAYTFNKRRVELVWSEYFYRYDEMVARKQQIKGWSRAKKSALIVGNPARLSTLASRNKKEPHSEGPQSGVSKDEHGRSQ